MVSGALEQATIPVWTSGTSTTVRGPGSHSTGSSLSHQETGRPLMTPGEVMRPPPSEVLVFTQGHRPFRLDRLDYLEDPDMAGSWDVNPMHQTAAS